MASPHEKLSWDTAQVVCPQSQGFPLHRPQKGNQEKRRVGAHTARGKLHTGELDDCSAFLAGLP